MFRADRSVCLHMSLQLCFGQLSALLPCSWATNHTNQKQVYSCFCYFFYLWKLHYLTSSGSKGLHAWQILVKILIMSISQVLKLLLENKSKFSFERNITKTRKPAKRTILSQWYLLYFVPKYYSVLFRIL